MAYTRISDLAASNGMVRYMLESKTRLYTAQNQVASEKKSDKYAGYLPNVDRLLYVENTVSASRTFREQNESYKLRASVTEKTIEAINTTIDDFRSQVDAISDRAPDEQSYIKELQQWAFRSMQSLESYLNTQVDGHYVFAGTRIDHEPVDLGLTTLEAFQQRWDGYNSQYPTRPTVHTDPRLKATEGNPQDPENAGFGQLSFIGGDNLITAEEPNAFRNLPIGGTFTVAGSAANDFEYRVVSHVTPQITSGSGHPDDPSSEGYDSLSVGAGNTLTAGNAGVFTGIPVGTRITLGGFANAANNGTFTVTANDGTTITVAETLTPQAVTSQATLQTSAVVVERVDGTVPPVTNEAATAAPTLLPDTSYYRGSRDYMKHRISENYEIEFKLNAIHPAFEKALRAMGIIAQGEYGTSGGLDQHRERLDEARWLLFSSLDEPVNDQPPYGDEDLDSGNISSAQFNISFDSFFLNSINERYTDLEAFLEGENADIENIDQTEAAVTLTAYSDSLQAAYKAYAKVNQLSLVNFI